MTTTRSTWLRIWVPLIGSALCLAATTPWFAMERGMDLVPFLLLIVAGWLAGHVVVGALALIERSGVRLLGHLAVALVFVALAVLVFPRWGAILDPLPPIARDASYMLGMAAIPMMGWVWLALIGLITTHVASPAKEAHGPS